MCSAHHQPSAQSFLETQCHCHDAIIPGGPAGNALCSRRPSGCACSSAGQLLRAQLLPRHRPLRPQRLSTAIPPGPVPPPHRPLGHPKVVRNLLDRLVPSEPARGLQPQPLAPLLLSGRVPAPLRIPHIPVIRSQPAAVTTCSLRVQPGYSSYDAAAPESGVIGVPYDRGVTDDIGTVRGDKARAVWFRVIGQATPRLGLAVTERFSS